MKIETKQNDFEKFENIDPLAVSSQLHKDWGYSGNLCNQRGLFRYFLQDKHQNGMVLQFGGYTFTY